MAAAGLAALVLAAPDPALAQTAAQESVLQRPRPHFTPIGIEFDELLGLVGLIGSKAIEQKSSPLSSFLFFPTLGVTAAHDSNVFLTESNAVADRHVEVSPGIALRSDWGRHAFGIQTDARIARYDRYSSEDFEDFRLQISGRVDIHDDKEIALRAGYSQLHEDRGSEDDPGPAVPLVVFDQTFADLKAEYRGDRLLARFGTRYEYNDYKDGGGFDNDVRDFAEWEAFARLGYEFRPGTVAFVEPNFDVRRFDERRDAFDLLQNNHAYGVRFGVTWDVSGVTFAEFSAGLSRRLYDEPSYDTADTLDLAGRLIWNATDIMTVRGNLETDTDESTTPGESGVLTTTLSGAVDYELRENILATLGGSYIREANQEFDRLDHYTTGDLGLRYLLNANVSADLGLIYEQRRSNIEGLDYENFGARLGITGRL